MDDLRRTAGEATARGRVILAHLGNGCSLAAVRDGRPIDTTMAYTPAAGLMMGTRPGDLDPGVLAHLVRHEGLSADALDELIHERSGLLGVSDTTADMRELLARRGSDPRAAEAVALFCRQARKHVGALAAVLDGLDVLVFAGGVGEHAAEVRAAIAAGLGSLGVRLDDGRNRAGAGRISADGSAVAVYVLPAQEERTLARGAARLLGWDAAADEPAAPVAPAGPLSADDLGRIDAYWRAANYLSVGQIYLLANPLLREPLKREHIKPRLLGHWGTTPGLNFVYAHLNRVIARDDLNVLYVTGPGHGGPGIVANAYLEGTYSERYPAVSRDAAGLQRLFKQFSFPGGIPSHAAPETPGSIHEGGELGYALSPRLWRCVRQPGPDRRLRRRRRRGGDRSACHRLARQQVSQPGARRLPFCQSST